MEHIHKVLQSAFWLPDRLLTTYLEDISDQELANSPSQYINHWNWQLGHLVLSELFHMKCLEILDPPELPEAFRSVYKKKCAETSPDQLYPKAKLLELKDNVRAYTLQVLEAIAPADLMNPPPEKISYFAPTLGAMFTGEAAHWMHHIGQLAIIRKHIGKTTF